MFCHVPAPQPASDKSHAGLVKPVLVRCASPDDNKHRRPTPSGLWTGEACEVGFIPAYRLSANRSRQGSFRCVDLVRSHAVLLLGDGSQEQKSLVDPKRGSSEPETVPRVRFLHPSSMLVGGRITPVAVIGGLIIMIAALVYVLLNRAHSTPVQNAPMHQPSQ